MNSRRSNSSVFNAGFTLLELVITIVILSILLTMAVPSFRDFMASRATTAQINDLAGSIRLARAEAIKRGFPVSICSSTDADSDAPSCADDAEWSTGWVIFSDRNADGTIDDTDTVVRVQPGYSNSGGLTASDDTAITFNSTGILRGIAKNFQIRPKLNTSLPSYAGLSARICMNATGSTRLLHGEAECGG
ncbi:MAG: GspH/FimT family pseudopilin [Pseudomonadota bacterium]|nr:GspH/FimT family pseudopilin [Pseudomonadota bacterium]